MKRNKEISDSDLENLQIPFEKHIWITEKEYHDLLIIKGKYIELKEITNKLFSLYTPNEIKNIVKFDHLIGKKQLKKYQKVSRHKNKD